MDFENKVKLFSEVFSELERDNKLTSKQFDILKTLEDELLDIPSGSGEWCQVGSDYIEWEKAESYIGGNNDVLDRCLQIVSGKVDEEIIKEIKSLKFKSEDNRW